MSADPAWFFRGDHLRLTDGGIETTLVFRDGISLPDFAAFPLLLADEGRDALRRYFLPYFQLARRFDLGFVLETPTWRASADWGERLGFGAAALAEANRAAVTLLEELPQEVGLDRARWALSGCVGPRGDGYVPGAKMTAAKAEEYHRAQIETFAATTCDLVSALTINYVEEAIGVARAARDLGKPVVISFTVETDGRLPTGQTLAAAIHEVDAATDSFPLHYMVNCAHPDHMELALRGLDGRSSRVRGLRANASRLSHAELNEATTLDDGDPRELGELLAAMRKRSPTLSILGGCCGTDERHIEQIALACQESVH